MKVLHPKRVLESEHKEAKWQSSHLGLSRHTAGNSHAGKLSCEGPLAGRRGLCHCGNLVAEEVKQLLRKLLPWH